MIENPYCCKNATNMNFLCCQLLFTVCCLGATSMFHVKHRYRCHRCFFVNRLLLGHVFHVKHQSNMMVSIHYYLFVCIILILIIPIVEQLMFIVSVLILMGLSQPIGLSTPIVVFLQHVWCLYICLQGHCLTLLFRQACSREYARLDYSRFKRL